eukprot:g5700.t1
MQQRRARQVRSAPAWHVDETPKKLETAEVQVQCHEACNISKYVTDVVSPHSEGYHLLCLSLSDPAAAQASEEATVRVRAWRHSRAEHMADFEVQMPTMSLDSDAESLLEVLKPRLGMPRPNRWQRQELRQPPAFFAPSTRTRLTTVRAALESREGVFLIEGGQFVLPAVRVGFRQPLGRLAAIGSAPGSAAAAGEAVAEAETLSLQPALFAVRDFISSAECKTIIAEAAPRVADSGVELTDRDQGKAAEEWRTSQQAWLKSGGDYGSETAERLDLRIENMTGVPRSHSEDLQVLRYRKGQFYDHHHDAFDPAEYASMAAEYEYGHKNRLLTVFWYLTDVEEGGHTAFPRAGGLPPPRTNKGCDQRHWDSLLPNGDLDQYSLHGGCPVIKGTKWSANKWQWNKVSGYYSGT